MKFMASIIFYNKTQICCLFKYIRGSLNKLPDFFRVGTFIDSTHMKLLRSNLLRLQSTCTVSTTSRRTHSTPLLWASQPLSSPQLSHNDSCYIVIYMFMQHHNDTTIKTDARRKTQEWRTQEDFFNNIFTSRFISRVRKGCSRFACERVLETEHKLHILTPLLWPSRCVFLVLLMLNRGRGVHSAGCWLPLLHLISIFSGPQFIRASSPIGLVWLSLPHLSLAVWNSTGNCIGGFLGPPRSGVAFPTTYVLWLSGILLATALGPKLNWII